MNQITMSVKDFKAGLQKAADEFGASGVVMQKKLYMDSCSVVDENGMAVDPSELDVSIVRNAGDKAASTNPEDPNAMDEPMQDAQYGKSMKDHITNEIRNAFKVNMDSKIAPKSIVVSAADDPIPFLRAGRVKHFKTAESAYRFGAWASACCGHKKSMKFCSTNGIHVKAHTEGVASQGGYLVPEEFENELITLREQYGVFRPACKTYPMSRETLRIPRRTATLSAYFTGEAKAGTESTQTFDQVGLVAKKVMVLTTISNELLEDALISVGDDLAGEIAYAFANKEDDCGFNGDGTSTYGGIVGLRSGLGIASSDQRVYDTAIGAAAITPATKTSDQVVELFSTALTALPAWSFKTNNVKLYCHKSIWHALLEPACLKAGGSNAAERVAGIATPRFFGYDVVYSQVLPPASNATNNSTIFYLGDLSQACYFGDRRATTIDFSDSALNAFEQDERAVRATERFDIVCTNLGTATACGPVVHVIR